SGVFTGSVCAAGALHPVHRQKAVMNARNDLGRCFISSFPLFPYYVFRINLYSTSHLPAVQSQKNTYEKFSQVSVQFF
ncbi:MAG: hypothetical protein IKD68_01605, partial [Solobacterium sp.]|nr:hypothetical protein [Solobacterium sp.]